MAIGFTLWPLAVQGGDWAIEGAVDVTDAVSFVAADVVVPDQSSVDSSAYPNPHRTQNRAATRGKCNQHRVIMRR